MAIGLEDYTADLGVPRTAGGHGIILCQNKDCGCSKSRRHTAYRFSFFRCRRYGRSQQNVKVSKSLGFEGMGCIHPRQIQVIRQGFAPEADEIEKSKKIVRAFETARQKGLGVVALGTKMIDPPVVARAQKTLDLAVRLGLLNTDWMNEISAGGNNEL